MTIATLRRLAGFLRDQIAELYLFTLVTIVQKFQSTDNSKEGRADIQFLLKETIATIGVLGSDAEHR
jgi:hypothetical protein